MDKETEGKLIAWEAVAREALNLLTPEQRMLVVRMAGPACSRREPPVAAAATEVLRSIR